MFPSAIAIRNVFVTHAHLDHVGAIAMHAAQRGTDAKQTPPSVTICLPHVLVSHVVVVVVVGCFMLSAVVRFLVMIEGIAKACARAWVIGLLAKEILSQCCDSPFFHPCLRVFP